MNHAQFHQHIALTYPPSLAPFDYMGYLYKGNKTIHTVAVGLGLNITMVNKAIAQHADVLLVHNAPETLIQNPYYKHIYVIAQQANLSLYRAHLPMDFAHDGLIDILCNILQFKAKPTQTIYEGHTLTGGVYIAQEKVSLQELLIRASRIHPSTIRIAGARNESFSTIAITTGDGCKPEFIQQLHPNLYICGLLNQESERIAQDTGTTIVELTSHATENEPLKIVAKNLQKKLKKHSVEFIDSTDSIQLLGVNNV